MSEDISTGDLERKFEEIDLLISRVREQSPGLDSLAGLPNPQAASTLSSICCSICVSTVSTIRPDNQVIREDPEAAQALAVLYDRAVAKLQEDGFSTLLARFGDLGPHQGLINFAAEMERGDYPQ